MKKGYVFKDNGIWMWGFVVQVAVDEAIFEVQGENNTWDEALQALIKAQIEAQ